MIIFGIQYYQIGKNIPSWAKWRVKLPYLMFDYDLYQEWVDEAIALDKLDDDEVSYEMEDNLSDGYVGWYRSASPMAEELQEFVEKSFKLIFEIVYVDNDVYIYTKRKLTKFEHGAIVGYCMGMERVLWRSGC